MGIDRLQVLVDQVMEGEADMRDSIEAERETKAAFLRHLVEVVKPALPALASKVPSTGDGGTGRVETPTDHFGWKGVLLAGEPRPSPKKNGKPGAYERLEGKALYLAEDGSFVGVTYRGAVERGGGYSWTANGFEMTIEQVATQRSFALGEMVAKLAAELVGQASSKSKLADRAFDVAQKVKAAAEILEGVR